MKERPVLVSLKVWGDYACMTRPELKAERVSYPLLTPSAARGVLESIYYEPQMSYLIHEIGVIKRGHWFSFRRNEVSKVLSIRAASKAMEGGAALEPIRAGGGAEDGTQRGMLALADVAYLITSEIRLTSLASPLARLARKVPRPLHSSGLARKVLSATIPWMQGIRGGF